MAWPSSSEADGAPGASSTGERGLRARVAGGPRLRAAIIDPIPIFCRGMRESLESQGWLVEEPEDPAMWTALARGWLGDEDLEHPTNQAVLVVAHDAGAFEVLQETTRCRPHIPTVVLLDDLDPDRCHPLLCAGATGIGSRLAGPAELVRTIAAAARGETLLPAWVIGSLARRRLPTPELGLTEEETRMAKELASGTSVTQMATAWGFSRREMHRRLNELYAAMDVSNRHEAVVAAVRAGII